MKYIATLLVSLIISFGIFYTYEMINPRVIEVRDSMGHGPDPGSKEWEYAEARQAQKYDDRRAIAGVVSFFVISLSSFILIYRKSSKRKSLSDNSGD